MASGAEALPCPCCGEKLEPTRDKLGYPYKHQHVHTGSCMFRGLTIGGHNTDQWNAIARLHMEVVQLKDGTTLPLFNAEGKGTPATIDMVNKTIVFLKDKG